ncbi:sensor histidine kinase [Halobaculum sp. MBLA0143]|uniref:sensor histidine kinase n=1 Tax=Halobaculum sp. MBLA0143 TaxID=3079933 RepID=UPI003523B706
MSPDGVTEFPAAARALVSFPEPVAVVEVVGGEPSVSRRNEAFRETFSEPAAVVERSYETVTADGAGPTTLPTAHGDREYQVTFLSVDDAQLESTRDSEVGYLVWTPPAADGRGRERFVELHGTTRRMLTADTREAVAATAANAVENVLGFPLTTLRLYDPETERLLPTAVSAAAEAATPGTRPPYERGETTQWDAFDDGEFLVYQDIRVIDDDVDRTGSGSMLVAPVGDHGVLTMGTEQERAISETDVELARVFAANVEVAMDRVEQERTLRERERELERQNERLDRFASVLSHDLRNPLSIASGYAEVARAETESEAVDDAVAEVQAAVERMSTLVDQTLTLAREGARVDETEPVVVPELAGRLADATTGEGPNVTFDGGGESEWTVQADRGRLERILDNLLRNAAEHCGPAVTVRIGRLDDEPGFYVADDGPGIPAAHREDVFEYGTSFDDGTGLGLAIVAELTRAHGWRVTVEDSQDGGARFVFHTDPDPETVAEP